MLKHDNIGIIMDMKRESIIKIRIIITTTTIQKKANLFTIIYILCSWRKRTRSIISHSTYYVCIWLTLIWTRINKQSMTYKKLKCKHFLIVKWWIKYSWNKKKFLYSFFMEWTKTLEKIQWYWKFSRAFYGTTRNYE